MKQFTLSLAVVLFITFSAFKVKAQIQILSGVEQGSYHQFVSDLENLLNIDSVQLIVNIPSDGAAINLETITSPSSPYKVALVQEDYLYRMQNLDLMKNTQKLKGIKVVFPLANEEIHLVTRKDKNINDLRDLNDKSLVGIGKITQGTYTTASNIKDRTEIYWMSMPVLLEDALPRLMRKQMDAFFSVGSAPVEKLNLNPQAMTTELKLVPLVDFNGWAKYYQKDVIPAGTYKWLEEDVPTFSVRCFMVVNDAKLTDAEREQLKTIMENMVSGIDELRKNGHPKWKDVSLDTAGITDWPLFDN